MTHVSLCWDRSGNPQRVVETSRWQRWDCLIKTNVTSLNTFDGCRNRLPGHWAVVTKGLPGLGGGGAACLCGTAGLDFLSEESNVKWQNFRQNVGFKLVIPRSCSNEWVQCCYPDKHSPPLVSVGLSQRDAHREAPHTCHLPRHPAITIRIEHFHKSSLIWRL